MHDEIIENWQSRQQLPIIPIIIGRNCSSSLHEGLKSFQITSSDPSVSNNKFGKSSDWEVAHLKSAGNPSVFIWALSFIPHTIYLYLFLPSLSPFCLFLPSLSSSLLSFHPPLFIPSLNKTT